LLDKQRSSLKKSKTADPPVTPPIASSPERIGKIFRDLRRRRKIRYSVVTKRSKIRATHLSEIEHGRRGVPRLVTLDRVSTAINTRLSDVLAKYSGGKKPRLSVGERSFLRQLREYSRTLDGRDWKSAVSQIKKAMTSKQ
jgi:transcriptional regulator with XRE-family HTH domain